MRKFKEARISKGIKAVDAAERLCVHPATLSAWERGTKNPTLENVERMSEIYGVSIDYLMGRSPLYQHSEQLPVSVDLLPILHGRPVWSTTYGWCLINNINQQLVLSNGESLPLTSLDGLYQIPFLSDSNILKRSPLNKPDLIPGLEIIVEPISPDPILKEKLRGTYCVKDGYVENSTGNRFFFDTYTHQWLAFKTE